MVIERHPALSAVIRRKPSATKKDSTQAWLGKLKKINLEDCVSFLEDYDDSQQGMTRLFEAQHNTWFDAYSTTKPLWRVIVVNRRHVIFVWHHIICDGVGGVAFHKTLLSSLNEVARGQSAYSSHRITDSSKAPLQDSNISLLQSRGFRSSLTNAVITFLYMMLLNLFLPKRLWVFSDALALRKGGMPSKQSDPTVTKLQHLRLDSTTMASCLRFCKSHGITFTMFLVTLTNITLSTDIYPFASTGSTGTQIDLRRFLGRHSKEEADDILNCSSTIYYRRSMVPFRQMKSSSETQSKSCASTIPVDIEFFKSNVLRYSDHLIKNSLPTIPPKTPQAINDLLLMSTMPSDLESFGEQVFPMTATMLKGSWSFSNLGVFCPNPEPEGIEAKWSIDDIQFSCAAFEKSVSYTIYLGLISMKNGACMINAAFQDGVISEDVVARLLQGLERRVFGLLEEEEKRVASSSCI